MNAPYQDTRGLWWWNDPNRDGQMFGPWNTPTEANAAVRRILALDGIPEGTYDGQGDDQAGAGYTAIGQDVIDATLARYPALMSSPRDFATWQAILDDPQADMVRQVAQTLGMSRETWNANLRDADASRGQGQWNAGA